MITLKPYSYRTSFKIFIMISFFFCSSCNQSNISEPEPPCIDCPINFKVIDSEPAWSPDGTTIAYLHGDIDPEKHGLYLIDTSGENNRILLQGKYFDSPTWSPDGEWIAFSMGAQICKMKKDGSQLTQLTFNGRNFAPAWSPKGEYLVYDNADCGDQLTPPPPNSCGVILCTNEGKNNERIFGGNFPQWKDSLNIYAIIGESSTKIDNNIINYNIISKNIDTFYLSTSLEIRFPKLFKDNFLFTGQNFNHPKIYIYNFMERNLVEVKKGYSQDFSPNGDLIVYTKSDTLNGNLWIMNRDGIDIKPLTKIGGINKGY